jgi:hypothetical protein
MRWVSSKESVAKGEVSVLAIVETLCAIALVFYLSSHFNTLRWLAIAMCVSPLLLLRTTQSSRMGIKWFNNWIKRLRWHVEKYGLLDGRLNDFKAVAVFILGSAIGIFWVRILATAYTAIGKPISALKAIPKNWGRVTFSLDFRNPPELIPGHPSANFASVIEGFRQDDTTRFISILVVPLFLPALLYRWSLKATSIIYAPLVFVARSTFSEGNDLRTKLELIKRGDLSRIRVLYGIAAIAAFLVMAKWSGFAAWWNGNPITEFLALYVAPSEIPKWQLAELANSALAIGSMFFARHALLRSDLGHPFPETPVNRILGFVSGLRWVLALYAIVCTGYITMRAARDWNLPALGQKWWPW